MHKVKKILIVTHGFYPEQSPRSFRATELAKEFIRKGHHVTVVAPDREDIDSLSRDYPIEFVSLGKLNWQIKKLNGFGILGNLFNRALNRFLPLLFEYPMIELYFKVKNKLKAFKNLEFDLLISIAYPHPIHWGVASVWKKNEVNLAKTWVADCGDPYCLHENDTFRPPKYFHWVEKWFMKKVDFVTVPTKSSYKGYFPEFHHKLRVIPQGFKFDEIESLGTNLDGIVRFGYGGTFIPGRRDPSELLEFLCGFDEINFEFHIYTNHKHLVEKFALMDKRIVLHEPISRMSLLKEFSTFNFVVNFSNKGAVQTPSKLIDYIIIEKPILQIDTGKFNKDLVIEFMNGDYRRAFEIEDKNQYRIENVASQFLSLDK